MIARYEAAPFKEAFSASERHSANGLDQGANGQRKDLQDRVTNEVGRRRVQVQLQGLIHLEEAVVARLAFGVTDDLRQKHGYGNKSQIRFPTMPSTGLPNASASAWLA